MLKVEKGDINSFEWIDQSEQIADALTKEKSSTLHLLNLAVNHLLLPLLYIFDVGAGMLLQLLLLVEYNERRFKCNKLRNCVNSLAISIPNVIPKGPCWG